MERVRAWIENCDKLHQDFLPLHKILMSPVFDGEHHTVLQQISAACLRSTGSVLVLLENDRHWDAELVLRSVQEGTIKFEYILSERSQLGHRLHEFAEDHFEITSLKIHDRATELINIFTKINRKASPALSALLLNKDEYNALKSRFPRKLRQQIEGEWGFTRLIDRLASSKTPVAELFPALLHGYGMASHLQHVDAVGIGVVAERESRSEPSKSSTKLAQIARIIADCNAYSLMRLMSAYMCAGEDAKHVYDVWERYRKSFDDLLGAQREWEQADFS
jgi:hypothetical protein